MPKPILHETIEESEIFCDVCGKLLCFIKWYKDMSKPCQICSKKPQTRQEASSTLKMLCVDCRSRET